MTSQQEMEFSLDQYLDCFGRYRQNDPICRKRCALNLRCTIQRDQNEQFEILEELASSSGVMMKVN
jgi:hypothetical protein